MIKDNEINMWEEYLGLDQNSFDEKLLKSFEKDFGIKFPKEYFSLILPHQGKNPKNYLIHIGKVVEEVGPVFHFIESCEEMSNSYEMRFMKDSIAGYDERLIPFIGAGGSGSCFALDFSRGNEPRIVFINADCEIGSTNSIIEVGSSINNFLAKLVDN